MVTLIWISFVAFILAMLAVDLFVINRGAGPVRFGPAIRWTGLCVLAALAFNALVYLMYQHDWQGMATAMAGEGGKRLTGEEAALQFFSAWVLEYSLSVDNLFVISMIFAYFKIPGEFQRRVLFWGIIGALVMRGGMIAAGAALFRHVDWIHYVFGAILIFAAFKMLRAGESEVHPERNIAIRLTSKLFPVTTRLDSERFFTRIDGKLTATPLFLVLVVIETTDVLFAVDSIPAAFAVTRDPFLVFTSNVFAIIGLRSLYFAMAAVIDKFRYLKVSLVFVLGFIGIKLIVQETPYALDTRLALSIVMAMLGLGVIASLFASRRERLRRRAPLDDLSMAAELAWKRARRMVVLVLGLTVLALSIPIGLLPGPGGIAVAIGGLALLATEFVWARNLLRYAKSRTLDLATKSQDRIRAHPRPWLVPLIGAAIAAFIWALLTQRQVLEDVQGFHWTRHIHDKHIWMFAVGPVLAWLFWSVVTIRAWLAKRGESHGGTST